MDMFSKEEWLTVGLTLFALVAIVLCAYLSLVVVQNAIDKKLNESRRHYRYYELDENEFARIGENALRQQRMLSFIAETEIGGTVEFMKGDTDELHGV